MQRKRKKYLAKDKLPPGTIRKHGEENNNSIKIKVTQFNSKSITTNELLLQEISNLSINNNINTWIHCPSTINSKLLESVGERFNIPQLFLENIQNIDHRSKFTDSENFNFVIQKQLIMEDDSIKKHHIAYLFYEKVLITFSNGNPFKIIEERLKSNKSRLRSKGVDFLLFSIMDLISDEYFEIIDYMEQKTLLFEEKLVKNNLDISDFLKTKSNLDVIKQSLSPLPLIVEGLINSNTPKIDGENLLYFKDLLINSVQITDLTNTCVANIENIINLSINISGYKMNGIMKVLTIISTIFIPLTFIAGIYGMNFKNMPELEFQYGYPIVILIMIVIAIIMLRFFNKKNWL